MNHEECYKRYAPMVFRRCRQLLRNEEKASEMMQETFFHYFKKKYVFHAKTPSSLLYTIATNLSLNELKRKDRIEFHESMDEIIKENDNTPLEKIENKEFASFLFSREKKRFHYIAILYFLDGLTIEEVALETSLSVSGVKKIIGKIREKARKIRNRTHV